MESIGFFGIMRYRLLYQAYGCKEMTKQSCKSNDKKTNEKFNSCIDKQKKQKCSKSCVGDCENVCVKLKSKMFGSCIGRDELILGNLACVEW